MKLGSGLFGKRYTGVAQRILKRNGIEVLEDRASIARAGDQFDNMCYALNYANGIHSEKYQRYIAKELHRVEYWAKKNGDDVAQKLRDKLSEWKEEFKVGNDFWNK